MLAAKGGVDAPREIRATEWSPISGVSRCFSDRLLVIVEHVMRVLLFHFGIFREALA